MTPSNDGSNKARDDGKADPAKALLGKSTGVSVRETWVHVFERNERVDEDQRLTDEQISEFMKSEFPGLDSVSFDRVAVARGKYNRGGFHKKNKNGKVARPKTQSTPHGFVGDSGANRQSPSRSDTAPVQSRVFAHQKDFKSHKK